MRHAENGEKEPTLRDKAQKKLERSDDHECWCTS